MANEISKKHETILHEYIVEAHILKDVYATSEEEALELVRRWANSQSGTVSCGGRIGAVDGECVN